MNLFAIALSMLLVGQGAPSAKVDEIADVPQAQADLAAHREIRQNLLRGAPAHLKSGEEQIILTYSLLWRRPHLLTVTLARGADGKWHGERWQSRSKPMVRGRMNTRLKVEHRLFEIGSEVTSRVDSLLAQEALFSEPEDLPAECSDAPVVTIEIRYRGRSKQAVRDACLLHGDIGQLMDITYIAAGLGELFVIRTLPSPH